MRVKDPFGVSTTTGAKGEAALPLLVGSFVHVQIQGRTLHGLFALPRGALRENGKVWVCDANKTLRFRSVEVVWSTDETVYVRGELKAGDKVVSSRLTAPLPGMKVSLVDEKRPLARRPGAGSATKPGRSRSHR